MSETALLSARKITKRFPGVLALNAVNFRLQRGEIHALLGENGAGKSTLIKILTGVYPKDGGEIFLEGKTLSPTSPREVEMEGISTVYQEVNLVPSLSIAENLSLGRQPGRGGFIDWRAMKKRARAALARLHLNLNVDEELGALSVALQQMVAIARALDQRARVLILDEPTASLDEAEVHELFAILRELRTAGLGIIFVTHFLDQVYALTDRITILRNGALVGEFVTGELARGELVGKMLGRAAENNSAAEKLPAENVVEKTSLNTVLSVRNLSRARALHPINLEVRRGEVLGLAGLLGSGRTELARLLFAIDGRSTGEIFVHGKAVPLSSPREAIAQGFAFCSEDRKHEGILPWLSVRENLVIALQAKRGAWRTVTPREQNLLCENYIQALRIKTASAETPIRNLSGGNQQKVLLARWLATQPALIILDEPTRGIDIGAKTEIEVLIRKLQSENVAVIFISSELEEILRASTRVQVMRERRATAEFRGEKIQAAPILQAMAGGHWAPEESA